MIFRIVRRAALCLLLLGEWTTADAQIVLANYSAAHPLKVMAIGDSITDDCVANGAWRLYKLILKEVTDIFIAATR